MRNPATLEPKGMVTDEPAVAAASMPEEKKEKLMAKLRQAISDEEECSVRLYMIPWVELMVDLFRNTQET